jgi:hypothetical protein
MKTPEFIPVVGAHQSNGGLFVEFEDGRNVFFSGFLLNATSQLAEIIREKDEEEEERLRA